MDNDEFGDEPTRPIAPADIAAAAKATEPAPEAPRKSMAAWAKEKGHVDVRKAMALAPASIGGRRAMVQVPPSERARMHVYGAASLVMSARGVQQAGLASTAEFHAALLGTLVTEAEYDQHTAAFNSIVIR